MIVARHVSGKIGNWRAVARYFLIILYMVVPWLQWNGRPAILLDIADRKFYFPGLVIWPQEFYYLLLLLIASGLALFLFTALWGRLWCGWACPQTVYTELFDSIGRLILPSRFGKRSENLFHKSIIHSVWLVLSFVLTFHFIAYFVSPREMIHHIATEGFRVFGAYVWPYFLTVMAFIFYFDLGFFREQVCVFICPYARFQSVMLDRDSIVIAYDRTRGEPRRKMQNKILPAGGADSSESAAGEGDCTSCNMCVLTCPTGIDIREGLQVACINCGHCVDACHKEMDKYSKKTLVGFSSMRYSEEREHTKFIRPRTLVYTVLMAFVIGIFSFLFITRVPLFASVQPDRNIRPYLAGDEMQNVFLVKIANLTEAGTSVTIEVQPLPEYNFLTDLKLVSTNEELMLGANELKPLRLVLSAKKNPSSQSMARSIPVEFIIRDAKNPSKYIKKKSVFSVPGE